MLMTGRIEFVEGEIEDYIARNERRPADYAARLNVSVNEFFKMVALYKEKKMSQGEPLNFEPIPRETGKHGKKRVVLNYLQRMELYKAYKGGAKLEALAKRFDISESTGGNIVKAMKEAEKLDFIEPVEDSKAFEEAIEAVLTSEDVDVLFEGDYLVIRVNKKHITRKLLAGVI